jgi:hypothetical protein
MTKRVLLDEGVPRHLADPLEAAGFSVTLYPRAWKQMKNGELLQIAEQQGFDVLITNDKNIYAQQNLRERNLSIVVLPTNLRRQVMERATEIIGAVNRIKPQQYIEIELGGRQVTIDFND